MAEKHVQIVRDKLQAYADRGVFQSFEAGETKGGKTEFQFVWLEETPFTFVVEHNRGTLSLKNLLPHVESRSFIDNDLRSYIADRSGTGLVAHRRVDPKRAELKYVNRGGTISLTMTVKRNQYSYGVTKLLNVVNELFGHLHMNHVQYLVDHFALSEE